MKTFIRTIIAGLFIGSSTTYATIPVIDAGNLVESLKQTLHQYNMLTNLKNQLSTVQEQLSLDQLMQQATGTVTSRLGFQSALTNQLSSIPNRIQGTFGGILGFGNMASNPWGSNPVSGSMSTILTNMLGRGQSQAQLVGQNMQRGILDSNRAAGALSQMTSAQALISERDKAETLRALSQQAAQATDQQAGQAVQTQTMLEGVAAQNEANTIMAADTLSRQEAQAEKRRNLRNRASGAAKSNMQSYFDNN